MFVESRVCCIELKGNSLFVISVIVGAYYHLDNFSS